MTVFLSQIMNGIQNGVIYASLGLAIVLIFRTTGILNFAQGEMALFSTYAVYQFGEWGIPVWVALLLGMCVGFAVGAGAAQVAAVLPRLDVGRAAAVGIFRRLRDPEAAALVPAHGDRLGQAVLLAGPEADLEPVQHGEADRKKCSRGRPDRHSKCSWQTTGGADQQVCTRFRRSDRGCRFDTAGSCL